MLAEEDADGVVAVPDDAAEDAAGDTRWATTLARVARGVVVIKARSPCVARRPEGRPSPGHSTCRAPSAFTFTLPLLLVLTNALHHRALRRGRLIPVREDPLRVLEPAVSALATGASHYPSASAGFCLASPSSCSSWMTTPHSSTEVAGSAYATGFVIDAARGLILTNRVSSKRPARHEEKNLYVTPLQHVAKPGPCLCEATFLNRYAPGCVGASSAHTLFSSEEVALRHVYVDSIHDYAILRYSPSSVAFQVRRALGN